ncbi:MULTISPECIES: type I glutamate--ammonia ligase [Brevibacillus]|jgi:glutamine synthetase|uniref:Glutamine synthetase n=1 Tax=Brevibacillus borstelensis AK1 TaxID=1300222 RepID=M8D2T6_9BACL|nr:type I glutamate--ammonia ligase [Brevibacillus borstelensis]EMT50549.1 glutamine synthetase [Brevibacillus borstelensis AK1]MCC0567066.1 type I glutamate--ammonia ligase [Brevibacillus borstelensis]MCM3471918.1 type I glutamate--ammonia ligase [Brevibacillus borstelensis]MCM3591027.1 type I glutamate--ammonia ligase [Brevibacillus borstelensis]MED1744436.1 type I glutamate--ammonia ligase [Brevibacillus borstelensis]
MDAKTILSLIELENIEYVDFRIVDLLGRQHHVTIPAYAVDEDTFHNGVAFDGSSLTGYKGIEESDMVAIPDPASAFVDPFVEAKTLNIVCNIHNPDGSAYDRDPRGIALRAEAYLQELGVATDAYFGPESEFFLFDNVRYASGPSGSFYHIDSEEAYWNTGAEGKNLGYKVRNKGGYFPVQPTDSQADIRNEMCTLMSQAGLKVERHHHEVATAGQGEINFRFDTLTRTADNLLLFKYIVRNVAAKHGKTATFMPKPIVGDNGSGMHVHQSLFNGDTPLFFEKGGYANLSEMALHYIGGILHHAPALIALTNPSTNSFKRLVPGYEAPVNLVFSKGNRSAAVRIPVAAVTPKASRIEFRTPDSTANPYLAFAAMLMAGLDGIKRKLDPRELGYGPIDKNIYDLSDAEKVDIKSAPGSLAEALDALERDCDFLLEGGVFTREVIESWIAVKRGEIQEVERTVNPKEFELYYDL